MVSSSETGSEDLGALTLAQTYIFLWEIQSENDSSHALQAPRGSPAGTVPVLSRNRKFYAHVWTPQAIVRTFFLLKRLYLMKCSGSMIRWLQYPHSRDTAAACSFKGTLESCLASWPSWRCHALTHRAVIDCLLTI